jgi:glycosyltransferase involved in cell wall biosynthesis
MRLRIEGDYMLSAVIPVFNEEESLKAFYAELVKELDKLDKNYEVIFVDDGSMDRSLAILKEFEKNNKNIRIYSFRKNSGKAEALTLGFQKAKGDFVVTLDADLQDKPQEISKLLRKAKDGMWDVVCGWRKERKDPTAKILSSKLFNFIASVFWGLKLHDYNFGLKLYSQAPAKSLNLYGGMHRFIPLLAHDQGFRVTELAIEHDERKYGKSKYGFSKILKDLPDIFTMLFLNKYSKRPLHFFGAVGGIFLFLGILISIYLTIIHFQGHAIGERPLLFLGVLLIISGFQILFTGFLADLIINVSHKKNNEFFLKYSTKNE